MIEIEKRLLGMVAMLAGIILTGTLGYHFIEGWPLFDSLYMTIITLTTVGYGETHPLSTAGRAFTLGLLVFGVSTIAYGLSNFTAFIVEGEFSELLRRRRMNAKLNELSGHYIICGGGISAQPIIDELRKTGHNFVVIEKDPERIRHLRDAGVLVLEDDVTEDSVLETAGIQRAKGLFSALHDDRDNIFVTLTARELNPKLRIVAREQGIAKQSKLKRSGADAVVNPGFIGGLRMTSEMIRPAAVGFLDAMIRDKDSTVRFEEIQVPDQCSLNGQAIQKLNKPEGDAALVLAVRARNSERFEINPHQTRKLQGGDVLVVLGSLEHLDELRKTLRAN